MPPGRAIPSWPVMRLMTLPGDAAADGVALGAGPNGVALGAAEEHPAHAAGAKQASKPVRPDDPGVTGL